MSFIFKSLMVRSTGTLVPILLNRIQKDLSEVNEANMALLQTMMPRFHFKHANSFLTVLSFYSSRNLIGAVEESLILRASNPLMLLVLIMDLLIGLRKRFRSLSLKVNDVQSRIEDEFISVFEKFDDSNQIYELLIQKDINKGWTVLEYVAELNMFKLLQINSVSRIVMSMWESKTDIGGSIFDLATSYDLTFVNKLEYREDSELRQRFNQPRKDTDEKPLPH